jgi:hypothetical protein
LKRVVTFVVILLVVINILVSLFHEAEMHGEDYTEVLTSCIEQSTTDGMATVHHWRTWEEYGWNETYCADYFMTDDDVAQAASFRNNLLINEELGAFEMWQELYHELYVNARMRLRHLEDSLMSAGTGKNLDRPAFARMVVAFVQDIPYEYVLSEGCEGKQGLCNPDVAYGIYSPVEFMYHLKGDCDTRTVLLYTLLKNFGYSPVIINSLEYRHSMLALDLPSSGDDFLYKGRRYAYWETTNVGWLPGMLPPEMNNKTYWQVALDYEYKDFPARTH